MNIRTIFNHVPVALNSTKLPQEGTLCAYVSKSGATTDLIRVHFWDKCKAVFASRKCSINIEEEIKNRNKLKRECYNQYKCGMDSYIENKPVKSSETEIFSKDDLYVWVDDKKIHKISGKYLNLENMTSNDALPLDLLPYHDETNQDAFKKLLQKPSALITKLKFMRIQRFYLDRLGYNIKSSTRTKPVLLLYIVNKDA